MRRFNFVGVTTGRSAIMRVFPEWARHLGLGEVEIHGYDLPLHAEPRRYREVTEEIRDDREGVGGLITSHKIDLFEACRDLFDYIDPWADLCGEVSSLSKRLGQFRAHAKDPISSGRSLDEFLAEGYWAATHAQVLLFGAGGSNLAITLHLLTTRPPSDRPSRVVVVNRSTGRLASMRAVHERAGVVTPVEYVHNNDPERNDRILAQLPAGSLVVNGTGMGKDSPGSPITHQGTFPEKGVVWELNYRGELEFLDQANRQRERQGLVVQDGWRYFVHGWTSVIEEAFDMTMTAELLQDLTDIAAKVRS
jgi:shikimate 5-dehydrogenase